MEPNYSEYSINELESTLKTIDQLSYPQRTTRLKEEIKSRRLSSEINLTDANEVIDLNEQFYKCPTCEMKIGFFSKTANLWGRQKVCPHCDSPFETTKNYKVFALALIPMLVFHLLLLKPILESFGLNKWIGAGIIYGIIAFVSMRYRKVYSSKGN
jgi:uncharacterized C2H2 Zn-finger protein